MKLRLAAFYTAPENGILCRRLALRFLGLVHFLGSAGRSLFDHCGRSFYDDLWNGTPRRA